MPSFVTELQRAPLDADERALARVQSSPKM
jgi:hypothetical protein